MARMMPPGTTIVPMEDIDRQINLRDQINQLIAREMGINPSIGAQMATIAEGQPADRMTVSQIQAVREMMLEQERMRPRTVVYNPTVQFDTIGGGTQTFLMAREPTETITLTHRPVPIPNPFDVTNLRTDANFREEPERRFPPQEQPNRQAVVRFAGERPDTTPIIAARSRRSRGLPRLNEDELMSRQSHRLRMNENPEFRAYQANLNIAKISRFKRERFMNIFKTHMIMGTPYSGKSYKFEVTGPLGRWYVNNHLVMDVDLYRSTIVQVYMPVPPNPESLETGPGVLNLTRYLFRMFGLGAVRRKDQSVITTATASRRLSPGQYWIFGPGEIGSFRITPPATVAFQRDVEALEERTILPDIRGPEAQDNIRRANEQFRNRWLNNIRL